MYKEKKTLGVHSLNSAVAGKALIHAQTTDQTSDTEFKSSMITTSSLPCSLICCKKGEGFTSLLSRGGPEFSIVLIQESLIESWVLGIDEFFLRLHLVVLWREHE